jgi:hypothetical protein
MERVRGEGVGEGMFNPDSLGFYQQQLPLLHSPACCLHLSSTLR